MILFGPEFPASTDLADRLGAPLVSPAALDLAACPLIVGLRPPPGTSDGWNDMVAKLTSQQIGLVLAIEHPSEVAAGAAVTTDVIGVLTDGGTRRERAPNPAQALNEAKNPGARLAGRRLRPS